MLGDFLRADSSLARSSALGYISSMDHYQFYGFKRCIYFGYDGWDRDVIHDFGSAEIKNDTILESLARAYSLNAGSYLWYQYGGDTANKVGLQKRLGRLELPSDERVQKVVEGVNNATANFKKIYERNKQYETNIGRIEIKLFTEYCHGYLQMIISNRPAEAAKFLQQFHLSYDDSVAAQNILHSAKQGSIIFTGGDIDTYTLLYLQAKHNMRPDLAVINQSMLGLPAYIEYLRRNKTVAFHMPSSEIANKESDFALSSNQGQTTRKVKLDDFIKQYSQWQKMPINEDDSVKSYNATHLYAIHQDSFQIQPGRYILLNELMLFDIINENLGRRNIYFSETVPGYLSGYMQQEGVLKLLAIRPLKLPADVIVQKQHEFATTKYISPFTGYTEYLPEYRQYAEAYIDMWLPITNFALADKKVLAKLVKECLQPFGDKLPFVNSTEQFLPLLYESGNETAGDRLAETFVKNLLRHYELKITADFYDVDRMIGRLNGVKTVLEKYKRNTAQVTAAGRKLSGQ